MVDNQNFMPESTKSELLVQFRMWSNEVKVLLAEEYDHNRAGAIIKDTRKEFEAIIMQLPYIGAEGNPLSEELCFFAQWLAVYKVIKRMGKSVKEIGDLLHRSYLSYLNKLSKEQLEDIREKWFSEEYKKYKEYAEQGKCRQYSGNWVYSFVEGDGEAFDFGMDFSECAILKFFKIQGAEELTPYVCQTDFIWSQAVGLGVERTTSIAHGDNICSLRWKRGRETEYGSTMPHVLTADKEAETES